MATLHFGTADRKVFTPISSALGALSAGAGTIIVLVKTTNTGGTDYAGLTNSAVTSYYHALSLDNNARTFDDDQPVAVLPTTQPTPTDTTNWWMYAVDWPSGTAQTERFHWRNQTGSGAGSPGSWTHDPAAAANTGARSGPGTGGWWTLGFFGDWNIGQKDMAIAACWAGTRFSDSDYGDIRKTSDLYSHALGAPTFLCELTATTLVDLMGGSTYSSANSSGTTLTGADPDNWTMDGVGTPAVARPGLRRFPLGV